MRLEEDNVVYHSNYYASMGVVSLLIKLKILLLPFKEIRSCKSADALYIKQINPINCI